MNPLEDRSFCPLTRREKAFQATWEDLVSRYGALLRAHVRRAFWNLGLTPAPDRVEERVQEVYYRLLLGGPARLRLLKRWSRGRIAAYLARMAERVVVDEVRSEVAVKRGGGVRLGGEMEVTGLPRSLVDPRCTPEQEALISERRRLVLRGCRRMVRSVMDAQDRRRCLRVLHLALLEGWSSREIARAEGGALAASTVDTLVHRVRRLLARRGVELPSRRPGRPKRSKPVPPSVPPLISSPP